MMDDAHLVELELLLRQRIGLNPQSVSRHHIEDALRRRMSACHIQDVPNYLALLRGGTAEFQELIEHLVVAESWFFRDVQPFRFLEHFVTSQARPMLAPRPMRLLSVPCGTGEEPYSLAITLLNLGLDTNRFRVDGVDISKGVLRQAEDASYGALSFREREEVIAGFRERFFRRSGARLLINDEVRAAVGFRIGNAIEPGFLHAEAPYDLIYCRNLLIYMEPDARRALLANLHRLLADDGALYVGHVEAGSVRAGAFGPYDAAFPFAFRRIGAAEEVKTPTPLGQRRRAKRVDRVAITAPCAAPDAEAPGPPRDFEAARQAADQGRLEDAAAQCLELLATQPPHADIYCLLGVVRQAQGEAEDAQKCFLKSLYLDPRHHEALVHLALLARQRGDESGALNYRRRADKLQSEG